MVDVCGYDPDNVKIAYFDGDELSDYFYVTDASDKKRVYKGKLKR